MCSNPQRRGPGSAGCMQAGARGQPRRALPHGRGPHHRVRSTMAASALKGADSSFSYPSRGFNLPAEWVIHTVGPIYDDYSREEAAHLLGACYRLPTISLSFWYYTRCTQHTYNPGPNTGIRSPWPTGTTSRTLHSRPSPVAYLATLWMMQQGSP